MTATWTVCTPGTGFKAQNHSKYKSTAIYILLIMSAVETEKQATNETVAPSLHKRKLIRKQLLLSRLNYTIWLAGHCASVIFGAITLIWQTLWLKNVYYINSISYRLALLGASMAFLATMSHKFGLRYLPQFPTLLTQLNFQFLVLSVIWCFTFKSIFKIIPLFLISVLQLSDHKKIAVVQTQADFLATIIAFDELFLVLYLVLRTLLFRLTSGFQLAVVFVFLALRILFDEDTCNMFAYVMEKLDLKVKMVKNKKVVKAWEKTKLFLEEKRKEGMH